MPLPLPEGPVSRTIRRGTRDGGGGLVTAVQSRSAAAPRQIRSTPSDPRRAGTRRGHGGGRGSAPDRGPNTARSSPVRMRRDGCICQDLNMTSLDRAQLAALIDHTLLKPEATAADVTALLREAEELGTFSVCVSPSMLPVETTVKVATVCGFPSGQHSAEVKAFEARESVARGADEVDMVLNVGLARAGEYDAVEH